MIPGPANLIDPTGGTTVFSSSASHDDEVSLQSIGFTGHLFGTAFTQIYVSTNGNLNLSGSNAYTNTAFPNGSIPMIAGLWDDLYIFSGSGQSISQKTSAGNYYAVTYNVSHYSNAPPIEQFQIALFGATTTIGSFTFRADDIALSYQAVSGNFNGGDATVGLNKGDGTTYASIPGVSNGLITNAQANLLPTAAGSFILIQGERGRRLRCLDPKRRRRRARAFERDHARNRDHRPRCLRPETPDGELRSTTTSEARRPEVRPDFGLLVVSGGLVRRGQLPSNGRRDDLRGFLRSPAGD